MNLTQQQRQWLHDHGYHIYLVMQHEVIVERGGRQYAYSRHELDRMMRMTWVERFKLWIAGVRV